MSVPSDKSAATMKSTAQSVPSGLTAEPRPRSSTGSSAQAR